MDQLRDATDDRAPADRAPAAAAAVSWLHDHGDYLLSYAVSRVGRVDVAEDLVQETLLAAMQSYDQFEQRASARTWLTSILRHKLLDHWRRQGRGEQAGSERAASETFADERALERFVDSQFNRRGIWRASPRSWAGPSGDPLELLESEEFRRALLNCLEKLPPRPAETIDLVERGGMNLKQVGNILGISTTHAGVILHRARLALRECLERNWFRET